MSQDPTEQPGQNPEPTSPEAPAPEGEAVETADGPVEVYGNHFSVDQTGDGEGEGEAGEVEGERGTEGAEGAAGEAEGSTEGDEPGVTAAVSDDEPPQDDAQDGGPGESPEPEPFAFRTHGQDVEPPGAFRYRPSPGSDEDYVVIPAKSWQSHVQPRLASQEVLAQTQREYERKLADLSPDRNEEVIRARAVVKELEGLLSDEAALTSFLQNFEVNSQALRTRVENAVLSAKDEVRTSQDQETQREQRLQGMARMMAEDLPAQVDALLAQVPEGVLSDEAVNALRGQLYSQAERYYVLAEDDDTARRHGISVGSVGRLDALLRRDVVQLLSLAGALTPRQGNGASADRAEAVARRNRVASGGKRPPDAVTPKKTTVPSMPKSPEMTRDTWESWLGG